MAHASMRRAAHLLLGCCVLTAALMLAGCSNAPSQLVTSLSAAEAAPVVPGDTPTYTVKVVNRGPNAVIGVTVHIDLPASFRYKATVDIGGHGQARTQPVDALLNSHGPAWGLWSLPAPTVDVNGKTVDAELDITFTAEVHGDPGVYSMTAHASSDSTETLSVASPLPVTVAAAPHLTMVIGASPATIRAGDSVRYTVTIANDGTGPAVNVRVLITMAGAFAWTKTETITGNSVRIDNYDPVKQSTEVDYGDFTIPQLSPAGPGSLAITFDAQCLKGTPVGSYPVSGQLSTNAGLVITVRNTVPVKVAA